MNGPFDPYYHWLGIPPEEQPPDHYRLLGIAPLTQDLEVILAAAERQTFFLRIFLGGPNAEHAQRLLAQIAGAKSCLLNPTRKSTYDNHLRTMLSSEGVASPAGESAVASEPDGSVFGEYLLLDWIGSSTTGQVYKAEHRSLGRIVALKTISAESVKSPELVDRFNRRVKILAQLRHPNLVALYDAGEREGTRYQIMEYVDGPNFIGWMKQYGPVPLQLAVNYTAQAAAGLAHAHASGVFHRNVKPSNLLLDKQGVVRVIGFGCARVEAESPLAGTIGRSANLPTAPGTLLGTPDYMAPEQAINPNTADARSDIYSLGCTLYAILTGRYLYPMKTPAEKVLAHREHPTPSLREFLPSVPLRLDAIFQRMVAKRRDDRWQTMDEVAAALTTCPDLDE